MSSDAKPVGYCRACGKALDETTVRMSRGVLYCEEHLPLEPAVPPTTGRIEPPSPYASPYAANAPTINPDVSPGLAFGLGLIPGVGAIYNGQYAKGLVHVVIVGLMISIMSNGRVHNLEPLFGLMMAAFWAYMAFEAYHTAKKRQSGEVVDEFSSLIPMRGSAARFPVAPILLIAFGTLFLLNNLDLIDFDRLLNYWPVVPIALGVYMLAVRFGGDTPAEPKEVSHERQ